MKASSTSVTGKTSISGRVEASTVTITDLKINVGRIKFEIDSEDSRHKTDSIVEDQKLVGPFLLDLLDSGKTLIQTISSVNIPNGKYEEIKLKFEKSTASGEMNGRTLLVKGTADGKPFVIWSDQEVTVKLDFEDHNKDVAVGGGSQELNIKIKIDAILARLIELTKAGSLTDTDGNHFFC
jgi:Domain of unknown function (DUF4382)